MWWLAGWGQLPLRDCCLKQGCSIMLAEHGGSKQLQRWYSKRQCIESSRNELKHDILCSSRDWYSISQVVRRRYLLIIGCVCVCVCAIKFPTFPPAPDCRYCDISLVYESGNVWYWLMALAIALHLTTCMRLYSHRTCVWKANGSFYQHESKYGISIIYTYSI